MPKTVVESPKRALDRELRAARGISEFESSGRAGRGVRASDWVKLGDGRTTAHCGVYVFNQADPRHIGRIEEIKWSHSAIVRWLDGACDKLTNLTSCDKLTELFPANPEDYQ